MGRGTSGLAVDEKHSGLEGCIMHSSRGEIPYTEASAALNSCKDVANQQESTDLKDGNAVENS